MNSHPSDEIALAAASGDSAAQFDLAGLLLFLWQRKLLIGAITIASLIAAIVYLNVATYRYSAELTVTPAQSGSSALSGNLGALASLAGADLSRGAGGSPYPLYLATLKSRRVAATVAADPAIVHHVFKRQWNAATRQWQHQAGLAESVAEVLKSVIGLPSYPWHPPGAAELQTYLEDNLDVVEDLKRSIARIKIKDADPAFAALLVTRVHEAADSAIRIRTLQRTSQYIAYLERKLPTITIAEQRDALVKTLSEQEKLEMQASATVGFAAEPLSSVEVSMRPVSPQPLLMLVGALVVGLGAGIAAALATTLFRRPTVAL